MSHLTVETLLQVAGGTLCVPPPVRAAVAAMRVARIVADSRTVRKDDVFWGLPGNRIDGADFAPDAFARGACGVVAGRFVDAPPGCWAVHVEDSAHALERLAAWKRNEFRGSVVAVAGSVGKTIARQMIDAALGTSMSGWTGPTCDRAGSWLPLSLLELDESHEYAVLELAGGSAGEVGEMARLCAPQIGVLTHVAESRSAMELLATLPTEGWAVLPGDQPKLRQMAGGLRAKPLWVGRSLDCDVRAVDVRCSAGVLRFSIDGYRLRVPVWGRHHLTGVLAAVAVGRTLGCSMNDIARGLQGFEPPPLRCQVVQFGSATVIGDAYNASPVAMRAALELLRDIDTAGRRIAVMGDLGGVELDTSGHSHRRLGEEVVTRCGADVLVACGEHAVDVVDGARRAGMPGRRIVACRSADDSLSHLRSALGPGDVALVKGEGTPALTELAHVIGRTTPLKRAA